MLDDHNNRQHDQTNGKSLINHRDKDGNNSREQRAKNRDKRPEEDQNDNRDDQGNTKEVGTDTDTQGINRGDLHLSNHVATHRGPTADCGLVNGFACTLGKQTDAPDPDLTPVLEEEEQAEQRNHRAGGQ